MSCRFAEARRIEAFLAGELVGEERAAYQMHLGGDCQECDALFASLDQKALHRQLIAAHDRATGFTPPTAEETGRARARLEASFPPRPRASWWPRLALAAAGACAVIVSALLFPRLWRTPGEREDGLRFKGGELVLRVERGELRDGKLVVTGSVDPAERVASHERLLLSYGLPRRGRIEVVRIAAHGVREQVYASTATEAAGLHRLAEQGEPLIYSLTGLAGPQTFEASFAPEDGGPSLRARLELTVTR